MCAKVAMGACLCRPQYSSGNGWQPSPQDVHEVDLANPVLSIFLDPPK